MASDESTVARCEACGLEQPRERLFCTRCTAPLGVVGLHELTAEDLNTCLSSLFQVLGEHGGTPAPAPGLQDAELWQAYLSAFWLRPETALILYGEAMAIRAALAAHQSPPAPPALPAPWLDLGCGDGTHTALYSGWRFSESFDCFQCLDLQARDIYHHWDPMQFAVHTRQTGRRIAWGLDIKPTAVARATALGVFDRVMQADVTHLPLPQGSANVVFSNMLRDLGEPLAAALGECRRVLSEDGVLLISAMTPAYRDSLYFLPAARAADAAGNAEAARRFLRLDRGRSVFCQRQLSVEQWQRLCNDAGLRVVAAEPIVGPQIIRFWDIGLRPFSISLLQQRQQWLARGLLPAMKAAALAGLQRILEPLARAPLSGGEPCMNLLVLKKA